MGKAGPSGPCSPSKERGTHRRDTHRQTDTQKTDTHRERERERERDMNRQTEAQAIRAGQQEIQAMPCTHVLRVSNGPPWQPAPHVAPQSRRTGV